MSITRADYRGRHRRTKTTTIEKINMCAVAATTAITIPTIASAAPSVKSDIARYSETEVLSAAFYKAFTDDGSKNPPISTPDASRGAELAQDATASAQSSPTGYRAAASNVSTSSSSPAADASPTKNKMPLTTTTATKVSSPKSKGNSPTVVSPTVNSYTPSVDIAKLLDTALQYNRERMNRDMKARAPKISIPALGVFTSGFGPRWGTFHSGIDIANIIGTPIRSVLDGTVIDSGPAQGYGQWVRVRHDDGSVSVYGHVETLLASVGQRVTAGEEIATMGNRGFSTGPHLHFEIHPDGVTPVDPVSWFSERGLSVL